MHGSQGGNKPGAARDEWPDGARSAHTQEYHSAAGKEGSRDAARGRAGGPRKPEPFRAPQAVWSRLQEKPRIGKTP